MGERVLHDDVLVPEEGVGVELGGGVEPQHHALLSVALPLGKHVGLQDVRLS